MRRLLLSMALAGMSLPAAAAQTAVGDASVSGRWLNLPAGARSVALGNATVASVENAEAVRANPAALGGMQGQFATVAHNVWIADTYADHLAWAIGLPQDWGLGISLDYLNFGSIQRVEIDSSGRPVTGGEFQPYAFAGGAALAKRWAGGFQVGVLARGVTQGLDDVSAAGFAADAGFRWKPKAEGLALGAVFRNLGTPLMDQPLSSEAAVGGAYHYSLQGGKHDVVLAADMDLPLNDAAAFRGAVGFEYWMSKVVAFRLGWQGGVYGVASGAGAGIGLRYGWGSLDYALDSAGELGFSHQVSMQVNLSGLGGGRGSSSQVKTPAKAKSKPAPKPKVKKAKPKSKGGGGFGSSLEAAEYAVSGMRGGDLEAARKGLNYLSINDPGVYKVALENIYRSQGIAALEKGDLITAQAVFELMGEFDLESADFLYRLGGVYWKQGFREPARRAYQEAERRDPDQRERVPWMEKSMFPDRK